MTPLQHNVMLWRLGILKTMGCEGLKRMRVTTWLVQNRYIKRTRRYDDDGFTIYKPTIKGRFYLYKVRRSVRC